MSEQLDYVNLCIQKAQDSRVEGILLGNIKTIEDLQFSRGYLRAMQDVVQFQRDYIDSKNPQRRDED